MALIKAQEETSDTLAYFQALNTLLSTIFTFILDLTDRLIAKQETEQP